MASRVDTTVIPNRVFIGCPWKIVRGKYLKAVRKLEHTYPLHFVLIGRERDQRAEELLNLIKKNLFSSTMAVFDVTYGNANVSLEYGLADARDMDRVLYLNIHQSNKKKSVQDTDIIADLAGQKRKQYTNEAALQRMLTEFSKDHVFTKRFEGALKKAVRNVKSRHTKRRYRTLAIKILRYFDEKEGVRRADLVAFLQGEGYKTKEIEFLLKAFRKTDLLYISTGGRATVEIM